MVARAYNYEPLFDRILVRKFAQQGVSQPVTKGGIFLTGDPRERSSSVSKVQVEAVGPGEWSKREQRFIKCPGIEKGDWVLIPSYAGYKFADETQSHEIPLSQDTTDELLLISQSEVLAKVNGA